MQPPTQKSSPLAAGPAATLACLYEATARKPGNVHPGERFDNSTTYAAFVASAVVIGPIMSRAADLGVGRTVLDSVRATRQAVNTNTNLGTILLLAPLAAVREVSQLTGGIGGVLAGLSEIDTRDVYESIRLANAGGLGQTNAADVHSDPPADLTPVAAMRMAADRDLIARQYTNTFEDVFAIATSIEPTLSNKPSLETAIIIAFLQQLAACPDSLIQRKCGRAVAQEASRRAADVLAA